MGQLEVVWCARKPEALRLSQAVMPHNDGSTPQKPAVIPEVLGANVQVGHHTVGHGQGEVIPACMHERVWPCARCSAWDVRSCDHTCCGTSMILHNWVTQGSRWGQG